MASREELERIHQDAIAKWFSAKAHMDDLTDDLNRAEDAINEYAAILQAASDGVTKAYHDISQS